MTTCPTASPASPATTTAGVATTSITQTAAAAVTSASARLSGATAPAVAHDLERPLASDPPAESVAGVREAVLVERSRGEQRRGDGEHHGKTRRERQVGEPEHAARQGTDHRADERVVAGRGPEPRFGEQVLRVDRPSGEKLDREQKHREFLARAGHELGPLTPALSKLAISDSIAAAHFSTGQAISAPVPSPRRMSKSSNGRASSASSTVR